MSAKLTFVNKLLRVITPTLPQTLGVTVLAMVILLLSQSHSLLAKLGITETALTLSQNQFHTRFDVILRSPITANIALMTFWASVGLVAYLICWGVFNILVEARNEVTLNTVYTNRGNWRGPLETLALKAVAALGLALMIGSLGRGISFWIALCSEVMTNTNLTTAGMGVAAVFGLALQLYAVLVLLQMTFSPWYRAETFT